MFALASHIAPAGLAPGCCAGAGDRGGCGVGNEHGFVGGCGLDVPPDEHVRELTGRLAAAEPGCCGAIRETHGNVHVCDDGHGVADGVAGRRIGHAIEAERFTDERETHRC
jgi:hypothetical protein